MNNNWMDYSHMICGYIKALSDNFSCACKDNPCAGRSALYIYLANRIIKMKAVKMADFTITISEDREIDQILCNSLDMIVGNTSYMLFDLVRECPHNDKHIRAMTKTLNGTLKDNVAIHEREFNRCFGGLKTIVSNDYKLFVYLLMADPDFFIFAVSSFLARDVDAADKLNFKDLKVHITEENINKYGLHHLAKTLHNANPNGDYLANEIINRLPDVGNEKKEACREKIKAYTSSYSYARRKIRVSP